MTSFFNKEKDEEKLENNMLENKSIITDNKKMINLAKIYKKNISKGSLNDIVKVLT